MVNRKVVEVHGNHHHKLLGTKEGKRRPKEADGAASDTGKMSLFFQGQNVRTTLSSRARTPTCRIDAPWIALFGRDFSDLNHFLTFCVTYL